MVGISLHLYSSSNLEEQGKKKRDVWVAFKGKAFAGYITLLWYSEYPPFHKKNIPEICDLNVLPKFRKQGVASKLLEIAEEEVRKRSISSIGIGVGLSADYGEAQKLYVRQGYIPDGKGITYKYKPVSFNNMVCLDDDLVLWFLKNLN